MSTRKTATPRPHTYLKIESWKFNTMSLTTSPRNLTEDFLKFCLYVEKVDFEGGPRLSKMAKIGAFAEKKNFFWDQLESSSLR